VTRNEEPALFEPDKISEDNQHRPHFGNSEEYSLAAEKVEWPSGQVKALGKPSAETFKLAETPKRLIRRPALSRGIFSFVVRYEQVKQHPAMFGNFRPVDDRAGKKKIK
jgi:hypothetical protein